MDTASVIAAIESGNEPRKTRFENALYESLAGTVAHSDAADAVLKTIHLENGQCSIHTAFQIYCTSIGKYQILGETLYGLGYAGYVADFVANVSFQDLYFAKLTQRLGIAFTVDELRSDVDKREHFATRYNGPGNVETYAAAIASQIAWQDEQS